MNSNWSSIFRRRVFSHLAVSGGRRLTWTLCCAVVSSSVGTLALCREVHRCLLFINLKDRSDHLLGLRRLAEGQIKTHFSSAARHPSWWGCKALCRLLSSQPVHLLKVLLDGIVDPSVDHGLCQDAVFRGICCRLKENNNIFILKLRYTLQWYDKVSAMEAKIIWWFVPARPHPAWRSLVQTCPLSASLSQSTFSRSQTAPASVSCKHKAE